MDNEKKQETVKKRILEEKKLLLSQLKKTTIEQLPTTGGRIRAVSSPNMRTGQ